MKSNNLSNQHQITSTIFQIFPFDWYTIDPPSRIQCAQRRSLDRCSSRAVVSRNLGGGGGNFEILLAFCAPRKWIKLEARRAGARNWSAIDKERGVEPLDEKLYPEEKRPRIRRVWPEWIYMYIRSSLLARTTAWRDTLGCCFTFNSNTFLIRRACCVKKRKFRSKKLDCLNRRRGEEGDVEGIKWLKDWDEEWQIRIFIPFFFSPMIFSIEIFSFYKLRKYWNCLQSFKNTYSMKSNMLENF